MKKTLEQLEEIYQKQDKLDQKRKLMLEEMNKSETVDVVSYIKRMSEQYQTRKESKYMIFENSINRFLDIYKVESIYLKHKDEELFKKIVEKSNIRNERDVILRALKEVDEMNYHTKFREIHQVK